MSHDQNDGKVRVPDEDLAELRTHVSDLERTADRGELPLRGLDLLKDARKTLARLEAMRVPPEPEPEPGPPPPPPPISAEDYFKQRLEAGRNGDNIPRVDVTARSTVFDSFEALKRHRESFRASPPTAPK